VALLLAILAIIAFSVAPGAIFLYFTIYPESESCWTNDQKNIATPKRTLRSDDYEMDMAPLFSFWTYAGLAFNIALMVSYIQALCVPYKRTDLTYLGQVRLVRKILFVSVLLILTFNTMTVGMRWEHKFEVCAGDLIPPDYYSQMEQYDYQIPSFYFY